MLVNTLSVALCWLLNLSNTIVVFLFKSTISFIALSSTLIFVPFHFALCEIILMLVFATTCMYVYVFVIFYKHSTIEILFMHILPSVLYRRRFMLT